MLCDLLIKAAHKANPQPLKTVVKMGNYRQSPKFQLETTRSQTRIEGQNVPRLNAIRKVDEALRETFTGAL